MSWKQNISNIRTISDVFYAVFCCGIVADSLEIFRSHIRIRVIQRYNRSQAMINMKKNTEATLIVKSELMYQTHLLSDVVVLYVLFFVMLLLQNILCD